MKDNKPSQRRDYTSYQEPQSQQRASKTHPYRMSKGKAQFPVVALVGDSDIERWPTDLLPSVTIAAATSSSGGDVQTSVRVRGLSGATLNGVLPLMKEELRATNAHSLIIVFCAGENDIGQSIRLDETLASFRNLLELVFPRLDVTGTKNQPAAITAKHLIVLGPKFEPWLEYDAGCRKQYFKMSNAIERACQKYEMAASSNHTITYVDCLTMFCGESGQVPGAVLGGKAIPEKMFFDHDQLHLSREGYKIWKEVVEGHIRRLLLLA